MAIRYIGSKVRVVDAIMNFIGDPGPGSTFVDVFCGTGVVAEHAARRGWPIRLNDTLTSATAIAAARITPAALAPFRPFGGYTQAVAALNAVTAVEGFLWREYSPASGRLSAVTRKYFTEDNARRLDGMRRQIHRWKAEGVISDSEERLLVGDVLAAVSRVANTAGTYGCFLRDFTPTALQPVAIVARKLFDRMVPVEIHNLDARDLVVAGADVAYLDPPYTKRQYAAYYHILETVAVGDEPHVNGITGLRPWRPKASDYCYKSRALNALVQLVDGLASRRVVLSYSSEGHVALEDLASRLESLGGVKVQQLGKVQRYRPNQRASSTGSSVNEYIVELVKSASLDAVA